MLRQITAPPRTAVVATLTAALLCLLVLLLLPPGAASNVSDVAQGVAALAAAGGAGWHVRRCADRRTRAGLVPEWREAVLAAARATIPAWSSDASPPPTSATSTT